MIQKSPLGKSALSQINIAISAAAIPEPNVAALLGGLGLLALLRRRRPGASVAAARPGVSVFR